MLLVSTQAFAYTDTDWDIYNSCKEIVKITNEGITARNNCDEDVSPYCDEVWEVYIVPKTHDYQACDEMLSHKSALRKYGAESSYNYWMKRLGIKPIVNVIIEVVEVEKVTLRVTTSTDYTFSNGTVVNVTKTANGILADGEYDMVKSYEGYNTDGHEVSYENGDYKYTIESDGHGEFLTMYNKMSGDVTKSYAIFY